MKHSICGFNHAALLYNFKLNYEDAIIIRCIVDFAGTGKMSTVTVGGKTFFWVYFNWILDELPGLPCKNKRVVSRWLDKYVENGLMEKHVESGNRTYYRFIETALDSLNTDHYTVQKIVTPVLQSTTPCTVEYNPPVLQSTTIDPSLKEPSINIITQRPLWKIDYRKKETKWDMSQNIPGHSASASASASEKGECEGEEKTSVEKIFDHWNLKSPIRHRSLSKEMADYISKRITTHGEDELRRCIDNYVSVIINVASWYTYQSALDDFFRPGKRKPAPCEKFFTERFVLQNFLDKKKAVIFPAGGSRIIDDSNDTRSRIIDDQGGREWDL